MSNELTITMHDKRISFPYYILAVFLSNVLSVVRNQATV